MLKILVVDDYESAALVVAHMCEMLGHEVQLAFDGKSALEKAEKTAPDLIFLDLSMPEMNGYEVCKKMRGRKLLRDIRIIAQTGLGDDETIEACIEAGFNGHLLKPVELKSIQDIISSVDT